MMKSLKILSLGLLLFVAQGFGQSKTIGSFTEDEDGEASGVIQGEFTDELTKASLSDIKEGRFIMRQRFEDPFDADAVMYQLFSGKPGPEASNLSAFTLDGIPYKLLAKKKFYPAESSPYDEDIEQVYFDGTNVYVSGSAVYVSHTGSMVALTPTTNTLAGASTTTAITANKSEMPEEDPYSEPVEDEYSQPVEDEYSQPIEETSNDVAEEYNYNQEAVDENMEAVYDRFGYGDDIQEYIGYGFIAGAAASFGYAIYKHTTIKEAQDVVDYLESRRVEEQRTLDFDESAPIKRYEDTESGRLWEGHRENAQKTVDDRTLNRNLAAGLGLLLGATGGILLTVDF